MGTWVRLVAARCLACSCQIPHFGVCSRLVCVFFGFLRHCFSSRKLSGDDPKQTSRPVDRPPHCLSAASFRGRRPQAVLDKQEWRTVYRIRRTVLVCAWRHQSPGPVFDFQLQPPCAHHSFRMAAGCYHLRAARHEMQFGFLL